mgnify:CR=1 FL=1
MYLLMRNGVDEAGEKVEDTELSYWRKFNALHGLILDVAGAEANADCEEIDLGISELQTILETLRKVKDAVEAAIPAERRAEIEKDIENDDELGLVFDEFDDDLCDQLDSIMPTCIGFLWGDTEYNYCYYEEVCDAIEVFQKALDLAEQGEEIYYYCWW